MRWILLFLCLLAGPTLADATNELLLAVASQGRADHLSGPYLAVDLGATSYVCRLDSGRVVKSSKSGAPAPGVVGEWAVAGVAPLDAQYHRTAQGASWLMHRITGKWGLVAVDEGGGYSKKALSRAKVPADVISKLQLTTTE